VSIKENLASSILAAAQKAITTGIITEGKLPEVLLTVPPQKEFGDFATNFAMQAAKAIHCSPRVLAQALVDNLSASYVEKAEIAGPGFINFYLKQDWLYNLLGKIIKAGDNYGNLTQNNPEKIQLEYVSANPTGPLHVGHGRGAAVGSALANLMLAAGYKVEREYYINDAGNQIDNLAASVNARYLALFDVECTFPENGYHGLDIIETAERIKAKYGDKFVKMDEEQRLFQFKSIAKEEKLAALKEDLKAFNCEFDVWFSEQTLHDANRIKEACDYLLKTGDMYEKDGALWLKSSAYGDDKDRVVIRDNGVPTYLAADIAYHRNKFQRGFDRVINLWGADHHGYIARMKAAVAALGYKPEQLEILILQMVSLYRDGELVKMSKRTGKSVTLNELIEEVGTDAARYFFIMRSIDSQLDFDLTLATEHSSDNPVYYVQYANARICSIMHQMAEEGIALDFNAPLDSLTEEVELDLIKKLGDYEEIIASAARERAPHRIAHYAYDLAGMFHSFYNQCRVLGVDKDVQQARLLLIQAVGHTLKHSLSILGVSAPEHM
jgi:arginyl-tRNA synthetase